MRRSSVGAGGILVWLVGCSGGVTPGDARVEGDAARPPDAAPVADSARPQDVSAPLDTPLVTDVATTPPGDTGPMPVPDVVRPPGTLPSGNEGIAARYPGDRGIRSDPGVIFADDFEGYTSAAGLSANWDAAFGNIRIATEPTNVFAGGRAIEFTSPRQAAELSNGIGHTLRDEQDVLFMRYYTRFDSAFDVVGSTHNGGGISAHYFIGGRATPGVRADGRNKFLVEYECWRGAMSEPNPGNLNAYVYHPEQRDIWGDHFFPDGRVLPNTSIPGNFGPEFVARPNRVPELGRWYSYELMVQANTPGMRDGRIAFWLDGALIADFRNLRLRDVATLRIDRFNLSLHIGSNTVRETRKYYDNVVAARSYIGPMFGR